MDNQPLDPAIEEKARALCAQITVAHDLDPEIQEELYGHVEDKILGYLSGDVPVSGDDALILVREHFGDATTIKSLLQDVHATEVLMGQWRRYAVAAIVSLGCVLVGRAALNVVSFCFQYYHFKSVTASEALVSTFSSQEVPEMQPLSPLLSIPLFLLILGFVAFAPWGFFLRWRRRLQAGDRAWYYRWKSGKLGAVILGLVFLNMLIPFIPSGWLEVNSSTPFSLAVAMVCTLGLMIGQCISWIWWCDVPPRTQRNTLNTAFAWGLGFVLFSMLPNISADIAASPDSALRDPGVPVLLQGRFSDSSLHWSLWWSWPTNSLRQHAMVLLYPLVLGGIAFVIYGVAGRVRKIRRGGGIDGDAGTTPRVS